MSDALSVSTVLVATAIAVCIGGLVVWAAAVVTEPAWRHRPHLAGAYGLLGLGVAAALVLPAWLRGTTTGTAVGAAVLLAAVAAILLGVLRGTVRPLPTVRSAGPTLLLVVGLVLCTLGLFLLWGGPADLFVLARDRFSHPLQVDNELPSLMAGHLLAGEDPRVPVATWLTSDRPPLQTGLLLLVTGSTSWTGLATGTQLAAASIATQLAWIPATWALARALRFSRRATTFAVVVTGISGTVLVNTVFTWPKLLSAAFVMAALAVLVEHGRDDAATGRPRRSLVMPTSVAALCTFGMLSHGAAIFAFPVVAVALWWARRSLTRRGIGAAVGVAVVLYTPWVLYQRFYDPPGDRLLKWHLAGVLDPDQNSVLHDIITSYSSLSWADLVFNKVTNLETAFALPSGASLASEGVITGLRVYQFFYIPGAVGLGLLPLALMLVATVGGRLLRTTRDDTSARLSTGLLLAAVGGIVLWCLILFLPASTVVHAGSHVPILLALLLPAAWLADRSPWAAAIFAVAQIAVTGLLYIRPDYPGPLHLTAVGAVVLGALVLVAAWLVAGSRRQDEPEPVRASDEHQLPPPDPQVDEASTVVIAGRALPLVNPVRHDTEHTSRRDLLTPRAMARTSTTDIHDQGA